MREPHKRDEPTAYVAVPTITTNTTAPQILYRADDISWEDALTIIECFTKGRRVKTSNTV